MIRRIDLGVVLVLVLLFLACPAQGQEETVNEIVAVVNGEAVTRFELRNEMKNSPGSSPAPVEGLQQGAGADKERNVLRSMINERLLRQEADRLGITVSDDVVGDRLERIRRENGLSREELKQELQKRGRDLEQFRQLIRRKIKVNRLLNTMVRQKVVVTEKEIRGYFRKNKSEFLAPREVSLSLILMRDREKLQSLRAGISRGEKSFSRVARRHSRGPNAEKGGNMGMVTFKDLQEKLRDVVRGLEPGEVSSVFPFQGGYALLRLDQELSGGGEEAFSRVRDEVRKKLYARKVRQRYEEYLDKLRSKAVVDIRL
ncbi:MAG: SurA N-terminal domain-containing protein [Desulfohalobiaceae bacterium]|nr:SurA N-terminal domain-containing protein [Desulfohalobiaceae bacterium]